MVDPENNCDIIPLTFTSPIGEVEAESRQESTPLSCRVPSSSSHKILPRKGRQ